MRVLVVSLYYDPEPVPKPHELARGLLERGHDVRVVTGLPNYPSGTLYDGYRLTARRREVIDGVPVTRLFEVPYRGSSVARRGAVYGLSVGSLAAGMLTEAPVDVVYAWLPPMTSGLAAALAGGIRRTPVVLDVQDLWPDFGVQSGAIAEGRVVDGLRRIERQLYRRVDRVIVPTERYRSEIVAKGIGPASVTVLPNWVADEAFAEPGAEDVAKARAELDADRRFVVLFAGTIGEAQGLDTLLGAAARCGDAVRWAIVGDGTDRARLEGEARRLGVRDHVRFLDRRPPGQVPALARAADALLVHLRPGYLAEVAVPTKLTSYLGYGRPVIAALAGEGAALVAASGSGISCAPGDPVALAEAVAELRGLDPVARAELGAAGRRYATAHLARGVLLDRYAGLLGEVARRG